MAQRSGHRIRQKQKDMKKIWRDIKMFIIRCQTSWEVRLLNRRIQKLIAKLERDHALEKIDDKLSKQHKNL